MGEGEECEGESSNRFGRALEMDGLAALGPWWPGRKGKECRKSREWGGGTARTGQVSNALRELGGRSRRRQPDCCTAKKAARLAGGQDRAGAS